MGMKMSLQELRALIQEELIDDNQLLEMVALAQTEPNTWRIMPGVKDPGLSFKSTQKPYDYKLFKTKLVVTSFVQIKDSFEPDLTQDGFAPEQASPIDMVHAIKAEQPVTSAAGIIFVPDDKIFDKII